MSDPNTLNADYKYTSDYQPYQPTYHPFQGNTQTPITSTHIRNRNPGVHTYETSNVQQTTEASPPHQPKTSRLQLGVKSIFKILRKISCRILVMVQPTLNILHNRPLLLPESDLNINQR